jgi:hypothetical protein
MLDALQFKFLFRIYRGYHEQLPYQAGRLGCGVLTRCAAMSVKMCESLVSHTFKYRLLDLFGGTRHCVREEMW